MRDESGLVVWSMQQAQDSAPQEVNFVQKVESQFLIKERAQKVTHMKDKLRFEERKSAGATISDDSDAWFGLFSDATPTSYPRTKHRIF